MNGRTGKWHGLRHGMGQAMKTSTRNRVLALLGVVAALAAVVGVGTSTAGAAGPLPVVCDTAGSLTVDSSESGPTTWDLSLEGTCSGNLSGITIASVEGQGTSNGAGLCDASVVATELELDVVVSERSPVTGNVVTTDQTWTLPITTHPVATPFVIGGDADGLGSIFTRIFLNCSDGDPTTRATFTFTS